MPTATKLLLWKKGCNQMKHHSIKGKVKDSYQKALLVSDMFRPRAEVLRNKYTRKVKHRSKFE